MSFLGIHTIINIFDNNIHSTKKTIIISMSNFEKEIEIQRIKVFKSGSEKFVKRLSVTTSYSMYDNELNTNLWFITKLF